MRLLAQQLLLMQAVLFVGTYARVAVTLPLMFQIQSESVIKSRVRRSRFIIYIEIFFAVNLTAWFINTELNENFRRNFWMMFFFTFTSVILAIVLGVSLRILRHA